MVQKLSGFAKFDLDTKINSYQFYKLVESMCFITQQIERIAEDDYGN